MDETKESSPERSRADEFQRLAEQPATGLLREVFDLILHNKKWWFVPLVLSLMLVAAVIFLGSTPAAPFIYTLF